jgi:hypothetical protein
MSRPLNDPTVEEAQKEIHRRLLREEKLKRVEAEERRRLAAMGWKPPIERTAASGPSIHDAADAIEETERRRRAFTWEAQRRAEARAGAGSGVRDNEAARLADQSVLQRHLEDSRWLQRKLNDVQVEMEDMIDDARSWGLNYTADMMRHYLDRSGNFFPFPAADLRKFDTVQASEKENQGYFLNWMMEPKVLRKTAYVDGLPRTVTVTSDVDRIAEDLLAMKNGDSLQKNSYWISRFKYPDDAEKAAGALVSSTGWTTPEADLAGSAGRAHLKSGGDFEFRRRGDYIEFEGLVDHTYADRYDYESGDSFRKPSVWANVRGERFKADDGRLMAVHGRAKEFNIGSQWSQRVKGTLKVTPNGRLELVDDPVWVDSEPYDKWR